MAPSENDNHLSWPGRSAFFALDIPAIRVFGARESKRGCPRQAGMTA
jgi:hypothetical protein